MKPAYWSLDPKIFLIIAFIVILFFPTVLSGEGLDRYYYLDVSIQPFIKKVFFSGGKNFGHVNVACNFGNFGHVYMLMLLT